MTDDALLLRDSLKAVRPTTPTHLWNYIYAFTGLEIARCRVCPGHTPPFALLCEQFFGRPSISLWHGPRGAGKSLLSAVDSHLTSQFGAHHGTRILGGSKEQSKQVYHAIRDYVLKGRGPYGTCGDSITKLLETRAEYVNGSEIGVLAASSTSVRGPHVPTLKLDEVDEIDTDLREDAMGMVMEMRGYKASVLMTSTWHRQQGPMKALMDRAAAGEFPSRSFCVFEVLERCPESRSGRYVGAPDVYEKCPDCPIQKWCHEHIEVTGKPKAKLSDGHYTIDTLVAKVRSVGDRVFESDYLCRGPRAAGIWFPSFSDANISTAAEYDPDRPVIVAIDSGVHTGAVWLQIHERNGVTTVHVFGDFHAEMGAGSTAFANAKAMIGLSASLCGSARPEYVTDPAGKARNEVGSTVVAEYERAGIRPLHHWPVRSVVDGLALVESFVRSADGSVGLLIHPRCVHLIRAFRQYARAKRRGEYLDVPADPQHPFEDLMDALRGGLLHRFPDGRRPEPNLVRLPTRRVF